MVDHHTDTACNQPDKPRTAAFATTLGIALAAVAAAYYGNMDFGFLGDARFLLEHNAFLREWSTWSDQLTHDYFWSSSGNTIPYWRPWTKLGWLAETQLLGGSAAGYHAVQIALHLAACAAVGALVVTLGGGPVAAGCGAVLFGLGPSAVEPVSLLMARSDVTAAFASIAVLVSWHRWTSGHRRWLGPHIALLVLALGSKETSVVLLPAISLWGAARVWLQGADRKQIGASLLPTLIVVIAALSLRSAVLSDRPGPSIVADPLRIVVGAGRYLAALVPMQFETGLRNFGYDEAASPSALVAALAAISVFGGLVVAAVRRRDADAFGVLMWLAGTIAPVLLVEQMNVPNVEGKFPLADRWLLQASAASSALIAARWARIVPGQLTRLGPAIVGLWAVAGIVMAPTSHGMYASEIALLDKEDLDFESIPKEFRSREDACRFIDRQIVRGVAKRDWVVVLKATESSDCPPDALRQFNRLSALSATKQWPAAAKLAGQLLAVPTADTRHVAMLHHLRGRALLQLRRAAPAVSDLEQARKMGLTSCRLLHELGLAHGANGDRKQASRWMSQARMCLTQRHH